MSNCFGRYAPALPSAWILAGSLSVLAVPALGQEGPAAASPSFRIRGFELTGDIPLPSEETTRLLAPFISNQATIETLQQASAALEKALRDRGFLLHRVALPPQEVGDKVTLNIVKFVIGKVVVEGAKFNTEQNIRASIPELREGGAPSFSRLAVQTALANENPNKRIQVGLRESEEPDRIDARVQVVDERPLSLLLGLSNTGNEATGRDRLAVVAAHNNLFGLDHQASVAYTTSLERSSDVKQLGLSYRIPLYAYGGALSASYTNSDVVGKFASFNTSGVGETYGVSYSHYLQPQGGRRSYLTLGWEDKTFNATKITVGGIVQYTPVDLSFNPINRKSQPLTLGYASRTESDTAMWSYSVNWASNMASGTGASLAAYQAEDGRIQTVGWNALRGDASYTKAFAAGWLWGAKTQFQLTSDALISGEQFGLGGASSVRGTSERPISGDSGVFASLELSTPELTPGLRLVGFLDAGILASNNTDKVTTKASTDGLSSVGLGLRYGVGNLGLTAEWARIVRGASVTSGSASDLPAQGDSKLHVNLTARF
ncbi:ShlB/FhaC/HecB family hemolysin secretion/activation protein [Curvibacter sp. APW13]|uniref:ShlB/FhaC/HecB family hemolysin secretion/activation protein n=1 Tax=Curvibacter sp. APW13 TaxID=3077236 RepID=UPI0028DDF7A9|nr:ShlB/FhaC/HecB family hemolysin secretion/activation protein [Curvibacter sp. APW13]MDT8989509.1 ShlB/FhaC/HecB family hemolysin secretion/activation protein [Curvibacter sp. APW13]